MAKLKKRADGLYQMSVMVTENGKKKRKYFYGRTQQEAKRKMMAWEEKRSSGRSFSAVADEWQEKHFAEISAGTQTSYSPALKRACDRFSDCGIDSITPLDVKRAVDEMAAQGYAQHSVVIYLSVLHQIFSYAVLVGDIEADPTATVKVPKGLHTSSRECPEDSQLEAIRNSVSHPFGLFAYLLLYTGLRRGELLALQWQDIDFGRKLIHVTKSASYAATGNRPEIKSPKTSAGTREVVLLDRVAQQLFPRQGKPMEYIFGGAAPLTQSVYRARWRQYCLDTGLWKWKHTHKQEGRKKIAAAVKVPAVTPHQLRHAYATMCYEVGIDAKDTQQLLGHSRIDVTLDTYTHIRASRMADVASRLNEAK